MQNKLHSQKGFTLIELMVVILIIAVLGSLGIISYIQATKSARDARRQTDMESVRQALMLFRQENGACFPAVTGSGVNTGYYTALSTPLNDYISDLPTDPTYKYGRTSGSNGCPTAIQLKYTTEDPVAEEIISIP